MRLHYIIYIILTLKSIGIDAQTKVDCLNSKSNYLYVGVDNPIQLSIEDKSEFDTLLVSISNGQVYKDSANYNCVPRRSGRAKLNVKGIKLNSDTINIISKNFLVYTIPPAKLTVGGKAVDELSRIQKEFLYQNDVFGIHISDDIIDCDDWINIEKVTMGYVSRGGFYERNEFKGNKIPDEVKRIIASLPSGKQLSFEVRLSYAGNIQKNLPVFSTRVY